MVGLPFARNVALAALAGWLLYVAQSDGLGPREPAAEGRGAGVAATYSPQDIQDWKERGGLKADPGREIRAARATAPRAASGLQPVQRRSLTVPAGRNGHFELDAKVNGKTVRFMVDTGASAIVLNQADAKRVGLRPREQDFTRVAHTANGLVRWAPVVLRDFRLGGLTLGRVEASVNAGRLDVSLLGMDFLRRLKGYEVKNGSLVLYW